MPNSNYKTNRRKETTHWRTRKRAEEKKHRPTLSNILSWSKSSWKWFFSASLIVATLLGYFVLVPRVSLSVGDALNPLEPFAVPFEVENQGNLPIYDVRVEYLANQIDYPGNIRIEGITFDGTNLMKVGGANSSRAKLNDRQFPPTAHEIDPGRKTSFDCSIIDGTAQSADITAIVTYHVWPLGLKMENFGFRAVRQADGNLHWYPSSENEQETSGKSYWGQN